MEIKKIHFDMDGVLADFQRGVRELACAEPSDQDAVNSREGEKEDLAMWDAIRKVDHFYDRLELMPGAGELFAAVHDRYGADCEILTAAPKEKRHIENAGEDKIRWARRVLGEDIKVNVVYDSKEKKNYCTGKGCVLIDDLEENVKEWEEYGGTGIWYESAEKTLEKLLMMEDL